MLKMSGLVVAYGFCCTAAQGAPFDQAYWIAVSSGVVKVEVSHPNGGYFLRTGGVVDRRKGVTACHLFGGGARGGVLFVGGPDSARAPRTFGEHDNCLFPVPLLVAPPAG